MFWNAVWRDETVYPFVVPLVVGFIVAPVVTDPAVLAPTDLRR